MASERSNPAEFPADLPEAPEGGGSFVPRPRPSPELQPFENSASLLENILTELVRTRDRLHALEVQQLVSKFRPRAGLHEFPTVLNTARFRPNEFPEGGEGGGGGVIPRPGEINEFPIDFGRFLQQVTQLTVQLSQLETRLGGQIANVAAQVKQLQR